MENLITYFRVPHYGNEGYVQNICSSQMRDFSIQKGFEIVNHSRGGWMSVDGDIKEYVASYSMKKDNVEYTGYIVYDRTLECHKFPIYISSSDSEIAYFEADLYGGTDTLGELTDDLPILRYMFLF